MNNVPIYNSEKTRVKISRYCPFKRDSFWNLVLLVVDFTVPNYYTVAIYNFSQALLTL